MRRHAAETFSPLLAAQMTRMLGGRSADLVHKGHDSLFDTAMTLPEPRPRICHHCRDADESDNVLWPSTGDLVLRAWSLLMNDWPRGNPAMN